MVRRKPAIDNTTFSKTTPEPQHQLGSYTVLTLRDIVTVMVHLQGSNAVGMAYYSSLFLLPMTFLSSSSDELTLEPDELCT